MLDSGVVTYFWAFSVVALLSLITFFIYTRSKKESYQQAFSIFSMASGLAVVLGIIIAAFIYYPYNIKYQTWENKEGIVVSSDFSLEAATGKYRDDGGLRIELSDGTIAFTEDFRLARYQRGQAIHMVCKPEFVGSNYDRYRCKAPTGG